MSISAAVVALTLVAAPFGAGPAKGKAAPAATPEPAAPTQLQPAAIPVSQVVRASELAHAELRRLDDVAAGDPALDDLAGRLTQAAAGVDGLRKDFPPQRIGALSGPELEDLRAEVRRRDLPLERWDDQLQQRLQLLEVASGTARRSAATWRLTADALGADAPAVAVGRVRGVRERIAATEAGIGERIRNLLEVQDRVAGLRLALADLAASTSAAETALNEQLFEVESAPLWRAFGKRRADGVAAARTLALHVRSVRSYLGAEPARAVVHLVIVAVLATLLARLRRRAASLDLTPAERRIAERVLGHPVASAVLVGLFAAPLVYDGPPVAYTEVLYLAGLVTFLVLGRGLLQPSQRGPAYALALLFAVDRVVALMTRLPLGARLVLLAVAAAGLALCWWGLRRGGFLRTLGRGGWTRAAVAASWVAAALLGIASLANVVGNVTLAERLVTGTLGAAVAAVIVAGASLVLVTAGTVLLHAGVARAALLRRHEDLLSARLRQVVRAAALLLWVAWSLRAFQAAGAAQDLLAATLGLRLAIGTLDVSLGDVVAFGVTLWVAVLLARLLRFVLDETLLPAMSLSRGVAAAVSTTAWYVVLGVGFAFAVLASGMEMTRFAVLAGTLGVGIGFGLQNVVSNFVSGLILLYERPVQVGDIVEMGGLSGEVQRIGVRSSTVRTFQGAEVVVPNSNFISAEVTNWTRSDRTRRIDIAVGVAYGTDPTRVQTLLLDVLKGRTDLLARPEPAALFTGFGDSALEFQLRVWTDQFDRWVVIASELRVAIGEALAKAGIAIPFPQRDLWIRSAPPATNRALAVPGFEPRPADALPPLVPPPVGPKPRDG